MYSNRQNRKTVMSTCIVCDEYNDSVGTKAMCCFLEMTQDMTHSNIFKPQGMFHSNKIHFENTPMAHRLRILAHISLNMCFFCSLTKFVALL